MSDASGSNGENIFEQIKRVSRDFGKQLSQGKQPRIEKYLSQIPDDGKGNLFSNLIGLEVSYRERQREAPTSDEYEKRFPQYKREVRRAFLLPSISPDDSQVADDSKYTDENTEAYTERENNFVPPAEIKRLGDYDLIDKLGEGGMGIVYEAVHNKTNNRVALKMLPTNLDGQSVDANKLYRFRKEFRSLSEVNHPNLVGMQTLEVDGNQWFFTMDLIEGEDFISYVRPDGELDEARLRSCLPQLAQGIMALHQRGIVHRDLKPSNVMVTEQGHVLILDFGLVTQLQQNAEVTQTRTGFVGTIPYAAPEQMFGERTEGNDWYGFGTMLYEALVGEVPFPGNNQANLLRKQQEDPPHLSEGEDLPSDLAVLADGLVRREVGTRLGSDVVGEFFHLDYETRIPGSTQGSQGSNPASSSVDEENLDAEIFAEEEIVLIGREEQLAQLEEARQAMLDSRSPVVCWVTGLSGEGKSALVNTFLRREHRKEKIIVLSGRCYERESIPLKALDSQIDPLVKFLRSMSTSEITKLLPRDIERLAQLFPILRRVKAIEEIFRRPHRPIDEEELRNLAVAAFGDLLVGISERFPIIMFIDDLQWADAESARIITQILRRARASRVLFIGSFRSDEKQESKFFSQWNAQPGVDAFPVVRAVNVSALSESECQDYIATRIGQDAHLNAEQLRNVVQRSRETHIFLSSSLRGSMATLAIFVWSLLRILLKTDLLAALL